MENITFIKNLAFGGEINSEKDRDANPLFVGSRRQIMEVTLSNGAVLSKHVAKEPIAVLCLAGRGKFLAGEDLQDEQIMETGTFITLPANVPHEVVAEPKMRVLVTKFKQD